MFVLTTFLAKKRAQRIKETRHRWKQIKELEEDYDVYVADEYALHIADMQNQKNNLRNIDYLGAIHKGGQ
jgi:hypothetical protein